LREKAEKQLGEVEELIILMDEELGGSVFDDSLAQEIIAVED
jgi:hypothetical protein